MGGCCMFRSKCIGLEEKDKSPLMCQPSEMGRKPKARALTVRISDIVDFPGGSVQGLMAFGTVWPANIQLSGRR